MPSRILSSIALLASLAFATGCGNNLPRTAPVSGTLTWEDGKPVAGASIRFANVIAGERDGIGFTGKNGEFSLSTFNQGDGAQPGEYTVVVTKAAETPVVETAPTGPSENNPNAMANAMKGVRDKGKVAKIVDPIPAVYAKDTTSPLKFKVESAGTTKAELKLKRS